MTALHHDAVAHSDIQYRLYAAPRPIPVEPEALEAAARAALPATAEAYLFGTAGDGHATRGNREAFRRWHIVPRVLRDVADRDLSTTVLGGKLPAPVLLGPVGALREAHPDGELTVIGASRRLKLPLVLSAAASLSLEDVAAALADAAARPWFELLWTRDADVNASLLARAERAGYDTLVVNLDLPVLGWRPAALDSGYLPFLAGAAVNYLQDPAFRASLADPDDLPAAAHRWSQIACDPGKTWADLAELRRRWTGAIVVKGILHPDDAVHAADIGVDGIIVSNHGGRQLATAIPTLQALPRVARAVHGRIPVLVDSGIRSGSDVLTCLALGATAVLLARPYVCGAVLGGAAGVEFVVRCLLGDLDASLAAAGYRSVTDLSPDSVEFADHR